MLKHKIGSKGAGLFLLKKKEYPVPDFFVVEWKDIVDAFPLAGLEQEAEAGISNENIFLFSNKAQQLIENNPIPSEFLDKIKKRCIESFGKNYCVSVRSSALAEDSADISFAGQYLSFLFVNEKNIEESIKKCISSAWSPHVLKYMQLMKGRTFASRLSVIIQKMVNAESSGVIFTMDVNGNMNNVVISAGPGVGEGIVSDKTDTDTFYIERQSHRIYQDIKEKKVYLGYDEHNNAITEKTLSLEKQKQPTLYKKQIIDLVKMSMRAEKDFEMPLDLEFSIDKDDNIFILQARPITTISFDKIKILDNTNISESYPGITLPLSISFAKNNYRNVFLGAAKAVGFNLKTNSQLESSISCLISQAAGRVYYRLDNWYKLISAVMPGEKGIKNWENSVGLKHGSVNVKKISSFQRIKSVLLIFKFLLFYKKWNKRFYSTFSRHYNDLRAFNLQNNSSKEIYTLFEKTSGDLFDQWYPTLINDLVTFISYGSLKSIINKLGFKEEENLANDLLCGITDIESEKPLINLLEIAEEIKKENEIFDMFNCNDAAYILKIINANKDSLINKKIVEYLDLYGDRTTAELKLEEKTFRTEPTKLIDLLKNLMLSNNSVSKIKNNQNTIRNNAEKRVRKKIMKFSPKWFYFNYILSLSKNSVRHRENMRFCRTRIYGVVKDVFYAIGNHMQNEKVIKTADDILYLDLKKARAFCMDNKRENYFEYVEKQKTLYAKYAKLSLPDRIIYQQEDPPIPDLKMMEEESNMNIKGTAVSKGKVRAKALVLDMPELSKKVSGYILVTKITDPGWIFLMSQAAGLIVEKGSLLSHSAIVGRELGIPTIVGADKVTELIKNNDVVYMDGAKGYARIEKRVFSE